MSPETYRDRSAALVVFGIIELLIGTFVALLILLVVVVLVATESIREAETGLDLKTILPSLLIYGLIAMVFIWIGIGSIRARKWARVVMLSLSWLWLITGAAAMVVFWFIMPRYWDFAGLSDLPGDTVRLVVLTTSLFLGFIYVLLPLAFVLFYRSENVAATCGARDTKPSWVDDCPQGLVNLVVVYGLLAASVLMMPAYNFLFPFFGVILDGWVGALAWLVVLVVLIYLLRATPRRRFRAWNVAMASSLIMAASSIVAAAAIPFTEWVDRMALPGEQREMVLALWEPGEATMALVSFAFWATWIGYLIYVRRFIEDTAS